jgi:RimJ/RimL family protein N-acetyltransferase
VKESLDCHAGQVPDLTPPEATPPGPHAPAPERTTRRLALFTPAPGDLDELFAMYSDPRLAEADPLIHHASRDRTEALLARWVAGWRQHGHGIWVLRQLPGTPGTGLVGVGGCNLPTDVAWNLAFTLRPEAWGRGYAQQVAAAGIERAHALRPELPVTAAVTGRNVRSHRAVERAGLAEVWRGPDTHNPEPGATLVLYSDRPLCEAQVRALVH